MKKIVERREQFIVFFKFIVIPLILILIAFRIFVVKTYERELFHSNEAQIKRDEISVGSEGYGNISNISVSVGDIIHKSDILYKYINTDLNDKIFNLQKKGTDLLLGNEGEALLQNSPEANITINDFNRNVEFTVRSKIEGIVKEVNINIGDYVTKDKISISVESSEVYVTSLIKVPVNSIEKIIPGTQAFIKLNNGILLNGYVKEVSPNYDADNNLLEVKVLLSNSDLSGINIGNLASGVPVDVTIMIKDPFTESFKNWVNQININFLKKFLSYEIQ